MRMKKGATGLDRGMKEESKRLGKIRRELMDEEIEIGEA